MEITWDIFVAREQFGLRLIDAMWLTNGVDAERSMWTDATLTLSTAASIIFGHSPFDRSLRGGGIPT